MPVTETEAIQGILNLVEGKLAEQEELFSQSLILLTKLINKPTEQLKEVVIEFIETNKAGFKIDTTDDLPF